MSEPNKDQPIPLHSSFNELLDSFRNAISAMAWLKVSVPAAKSFFSSYPYIIELPCSVVSQVIKVDKSILNLVESEGFNKETPFFSKTLISLFKIITIAIKDIIWEDSDFQSLKNEPLLKFLKHLRNTCAHHGSFYFGTGQQRLKTLEELPLIWRGKVIDEALEGTQLYMDFFKPGDLFILLADITALAKSHSPESI